MLGVVILFKLRNMSHHRVTEDHRGDHPKTLREALSFPFSVLSTEKGKTISLSALCALSEAGGEINVLILHFKFLGGKKHGEDQPWRNDSCVSLMGDNPIISCQGKK